MGLAEDIDAEEDDIAERGVKVGMLEDETGARCIPGGERAIGEDMF